MRNKLYLGDGVYLEVSDAGTLVLTTSDGISDTNTIVLEPEILARFEIAVKKLREVAHAEWVSRQGNKSPQG